MHFTRTLHKSTPLKPPHGLDGSRAVGFMSCLCRLTSRVCVRMLMNSAVCSPAPTSPRARELSCPLHLLRDKRAKCRTCILHLLSDARARAPNPYLDAFQRCKTAIVTAILVWFVVYVGYSSPCGLNLRWIFHTVDDKYKVLFHKFIFCVNYYLCIYDTFLQILIKGHMHLMNKQTNRDFPRKCCFLYKYDVLDFK